MMKLTDATKELLTTITNHGGVCSAHELQAWLGLDLDDSKAYAQALVRNRLLRAHKHPTYPDTIYQLTPTGVDLGLGTEGRGNSTRICRLDAPPHALAAGFLRAYVYAHASAEILIAETAAEGLKNVLNIAHKSAQNSAQFSAQNSVEYVADGEHKLLLHFPTTGGGLAQQIGQRLAQWCAHDKCIQHVFVLPAEMVNPACTILAKNGMPGEAIPVGSLEQFLHAGLPHALTRGTCWQPNMPSKIKPGEPVNTPLWISPADALAAYNALDKMLLMQNPPAEQLHELYQYARLCRTVDRYWLTSEERSARKQALAACPPALLPEVAKARSARLADLEQTSTENAPDWSRDRIAGTCWDQSRFTDKPQTSTRFAVLFHTHTEVCHG